MLFWPRIPVDTTGTSDVGLDLTGQVVAGLKVRGLLGSGGMGQVYLADPIGAGAPRALKVIGSELRGNAQAISRFRREAHVLTKLHHDHIIKIFDCGELANGTMFISLEFIEGGDLENHLETNGPMSLVGALRVLADVADAVRYAHAQGVVHRDLKPGNIVLRDGDPAQTKVIDFGLVTLMGVEHATRLTETNMVVGSPLFMAPEQIRGDEHATGAVDVYALAGLAYSLLTCEPVFPSDEYESILSLIRAHCHDAPTPLSHRRPSLQSPEFLDTLLLACLAKNPEHRPSAEEVSFHLTRLHREATALMQSSAGRSVPTTVAAEHSRASSAGVAKIIWNEDAANGHSPAQARLDALGKQIEEVLLEIGDVLETTSTEQSAADTAIGRIRQIESALSNLELEQALLASDADDSEGSRQADLLRQRILMGARIDELQQAKQSQFREFYAYLMDGARAQISDEDILLETLDKLVETFLLAVDS